MVIFLGKKPNPLPKLGVGNTATLKVLYAIIDVSKYYFPSNFAIKVLFT